LGFRHHRAGDHSPAADLSADADRHEASGRDDGPAGQAQAHLDKLNEKYKDNPTKRNQEMMKLYREHNVNPFGMLKGCMWMLIQLPIFFALYKLLSQDFDLRGASFLWIEDLSKADHLFHFGFSIPWMGEYFNLLPVMTAATQMLVSKLTMNPQAISDPQQAAIQKQMMYMMPIMILVMTYHFPSGLCLYWMISNVWQVFQQRFVNRKYMPAPAPAATTS
jgi:YidC/Oxa1 family membrane protein insertase